MFILKQIFRIREKAQISNNDEEKPFLDHLDDLRKVIVRMVLTILVVTMLCFQFAPFLMDVLRRPVDQVWSMYEEARLPTTVSVEAWGKAKTLAYSLGGVDEKVRKNIIDSQDPQMRQLIEIALLLRISALLPADQQASFITKNASSPALAQKAFELKDKNAVLTEGSERGSLKLMGAFQPGEAFMLSLKLAFYGGVLLSFPLLLFFLLQFIVPGLHLHERKLLYKSLFAGFALFLTGVCFAYFIVLPRVLTFFYEYSLDFGIANDWRIGYYISFATQIVFMFGLGFELPILLIPFIKLGVLTYDLMKKTRSYAIVAIAVLAAVITPTPDIITMMLMAIPLYALYESCIIYAYFEQKRQLKKAAEEEAEFQAQHESGEGPYHPE